MALNYQRVGWEDAPSTNTPLDAANLNHMDNGIVALSNEFDRVIPGLEEIAETVSPLLPSMSTMIQDISTLQGQTSALATQAQHILGNFATVEEGETASANYSTGQHVVLGGYLYKVIDDIAQGESFVENTNIVKTTVGSEVEGLKSEIDELNSNLEWKSLPSGSTVNLPSQYSELIVRLYESSLNSAFTFHFCREQLLDTITYYRMGYNAGSAVANVAVIEATRQFIHLYAYYQDGTVYTPEMTVYYR